MGIDVQGFHFLNYVSGRRGLGDVATIGRQQLNINPNQFRRLVELGNVNIQEYQFGMFCKSLLRQKFGAKMVQLI